MRSGTTAGTYIPTPRHVDDISAFRAANHELTRILNLITVLSATRAGKEKLKTHRQRQVHGNHDSLTRTPTPDDDFQALETVFSSGKTLKKILTTHWEFIVPKRHVVARDRLARLSTFEPRGPKQVFDIPSQPSNIVAGSSRIS
jgi:hypothetical protein